MLIFFIFYIFFKKLSLTELLTNALKAFVSMILKKINELTRG